MFWVCRNSSLGVVDRVFENLIVVCNNIFNNMYVKLNVFSLSVYNFFRSKSFCY